MTATEKSTASIKGFDANLQCRGYQFEIGKTYKVGGRIIACGNGFHACPEDQHPLSVFDYYPPAGSRYCLVEQSGDTDAEGNKLASARITIGVEITLSDLAQRAVKWVFDRANWKDGPVATKDNEGATASGTRGAATASGDQGAATASGDQGAATASGYQGAATASGDQGAATASGDQGAATASGYQGAATASGTRGAATASGTRGAATASGDQGAATASGDQGAATASGYQGAATAESATCVAIATGYDGKARAVEGAAICLVNRDPNTGRIRHIKATICGQDGIEAGKWYRLNAKGAFVEVE
jgi:hypothetical protein